MLENRLRRSWRSIAATTSATTARSRASSSNVACASSCSVISSRLFPGPEVLGERAHHPLEPGGLRRTLDDLDQPRGLIRLDQQIVEPLRIVLVALLEVL